MKKVYEKAEVKVYEMEIESAILEGSQTGPNIGVGGEVGSEAEGNDA